jgi:hypothetical protein
MADPATGYSGRPLVAKLGIVPGARATWVDAPAGFVQLLGPLPEGVRLKGSLRGGVDVAVCFVVERAVLRRRLRPLMRAIAPDGMAWIAWPKRASGVPTDITEDVVRDLALALGLVDVKVCAIDATWSGLKLVIRRELR